MFVLSAVKVYSVPTWTCELMNYCFPIGLTAGMMAFYCFKLADHICPLSDSVVCHCVNHGDVGHFFHCCLMLSTLKSAAFLC
jgi:hypothetical protein